jgi:hypothetical protein
LETSGAFLICVFYYCVNVNVEFDLNEIFVPAAPEDSKLFENA